MFTKRKRIFYVSCSSQVQGGKYHIFLRKKHAYFTENENIVFRLEEKQSQSRKWQRKFTLQQSRILFFFSFLFCSSNISGKEKTWEKIFLPETNLVITE